MMALLPMLSDPQDDQVQRTLRAMQAILGGALRAVFLQGSAVTAPLLPDGERQCLALARRAYLGLAKDDWEARQEEARRTAECLRDRALECL